MIYSLCILAPYPFYLNYCEIMFSFLKNLLLEIRCLVEKDAYFDCEMFN